VDVTPVVWVITVVGVLGILLADFVVVSRRPHRPTSHEALRWVGLYVTLAVLFGLVVWATWGGTYASQFYAGWLTEYSLSLDNLFVFVVIMARFAVPAALQQSVLVIGIMLALVLRGVFIAVGAAAIERFSAVFYLFGAFLLWTAWKLATGGDESEEFRENALLRWVGRVVPTTPEYHGVRLRVSVDGRQVFTPMLVVMVAIGTTDLLFAVDSIPAIFGLTQEPYLVFTANAFALMGLIQLYFVLGGLLDRLRYLGAGLAVILGFVGVKLILEALHTNEVPFINGGEPLGWAPEIPPLVSLVVIAVTLALTAAASLLAERREQTSAD
jgi:tellurite resistance protein TerC